MKPKDVLLALKAICSIWVFNFSSAENVLIFFCNVLILIIGPECFSEK